MTTDTTALSPHEEAIARFAALVRRGEIADHEGGLRLGVDLGTANIVVSVVGATGRPVAGGMLHSTVVRDGVVVDWAGATGAVRQLTEDLEARLGHRFERASVSVPPGISAGDIRVFENVIVAAGLDVDEVVDEPVAAARALGITDGCVIDIGHGTTGVSVIENGRVRLSVDEATGGHHMTLVLAGACQLGYEEAEAMKKDPARCRDVAGIIRPTLDKMASIAERSLRGLELPVVHLVGGSSSFPNAPEVFAARLGRPVVRLVEPLFVTPLGIPMTAEESHSS